jgi:hypothetical protein
VRRLLAKQIPVDYGTINRWINGSSTPRDPDVIRELARRVREIDPQIEAALRDVPEFLPAFELPASEDDVRVPASYSEDALEMLASVAKFVSQYTIQSHVYEYIVSQLDPHKDGLMLLFVQCIEPASPSEKVTALKAVPGRGTGPWAANQIEHAFIIGSGTLCAAAIASGRPAFYPVDQSFMRSVPLHAQEHIRSFGAFPVSRWGDEIAGVLFIASVHTDFFTPTRRKLMKTYANMFALSLKEMQFYSSDRIDLQPFPSAQNQSAVLKRFHRAIVSLHEQPEYKDLSVEELERLAIQRIDEICLKEQEDYA